MKRFWSKVDKSGPNGCWLWTASKNKRGYGKFGVGKFPKGRWMHAHRASYEINVGQIPAGMCVLHRCDVPACVNPAHLWIGTNSDNMRDKVAKGRQGIGDDNSMSKLTAEWVRKIRDSDEPCSHFAALTGTSFQTVWKARTRQTWKHVA